MAHRSLFSGFGKRVALAVGGVCLTLTMPAAVVALGDNRAEVATARLLPSFARFTPAGMDTELARRAEAIAEERGLTFTPAGNVGLRSRPITVAVRIDDEVARAVTIRRSAALAAAGSSSTARTPLAITPSRFDLGIARGYQSFAQSAPSVPAQLGLGTRTPVLDNVPMADLASFGRPVADRGGKPSRFSSRVVFETEEGAPGRPPRTLEALGEQSVDVSGSYRVLKNLNVTAGVRLSQDRDRLAPLTDGVEDDKAVYVGTQFKF